VNIRKRLDASSDGLLQTFRSVGLKKSYGRLYVGEQVLASVLSFTCEGSDLILGALLFCISLAIFDAPMILPSTFLTGDTVNENDNPAAMLGVEHGMLDVAVSEIHLERSCIVVLIGTSMPNHMRVC
jgi:hypothetical protein